MAKSIELFVPNCNNYRDWILFIQENRIPKYKTSDRVLFNFKKLNFILPFQIVSLACLIEELYTNGIGVSFYCENTKMCEYLNDIKFFTYWSGKFDRSKFIPNSKSTSLCLWQINKNWIDNYAPASQKYFERNFLNDKDLISLNIAIVEAMNNVCDHSGSSIQGYTISQIYPNLEILRTSICDFGVGIVNKIISNSENTLTEVQAINSAMQLGFTTKSHKQNAGLGLPNLRSNVIGKKGKLNICTNLIRMEINELDAISVMNLSQTFNGTLIDFYFQTRDFDIIDEELVDFNEI